MTSEERQRIVEQLEDWALGTAQEWMRYGDFAGDGDFTFQAHVNWQDHQGTFTLGESQYSDEYGAFRLTVHIEDLGPVSPLGPENDPAQIEEVREEPPQWYARTMADVRPGDLIRPTTSEAQAHVTARCWPPTDDARGRGSWHVIEGSGGHWDDHVVQPGECCVHLDGAGHRLFRPTFAVEILLSPSEVQAIELLGGWEHRERMITE